MKKRKMDSRFLEDKEALSFYGLSADDPMEKFCCAKIMVNGKTLPLCELSTKKLSNIAMKPNSFKFPSFIRRATMEIINTRIDNGDDKVEVSAEELE